MVRRLLILCALLASLALAPAAQATTQSARSGRVSATFTFHGIFPNYKDETLTIARAGKVVYRQPVASSLCGGTCIPISKVGRRSSVRVLDLEHDHEPDVVLGLFSGGAHCCWIGQVFSFDRATGTYVKTEHDFGDPGERIVDLRHNGHLEFLTADDAFAYAFTDFAASGLPIQILTFSHRQFHNVTRRFPKLVAKDAALWLDAFKRTAANRYLDSVGAIAAWAADEDLLGQRKLADSYVAAQVKAGHVNTATGHVGPKFLARLDRFLRAHGYLR